MPTSTSSLSSVYGPVHSWRYGKSLGIDPIGTISRCSFNCVYCQLGEIEDQTGQRAEFVPTSQILQDLQPFSPWEVDAITLSGSGEPTLALNLADIITQTQKLTTRPVVILTNGTLLYDPEVRAALSLADEVSVKLDAVDTPQLQGINRPLAKIDWSPIWGHLTQFRQQYGGRLSIQTMMLTPWRDRERKRYLHLMQSLTPDEIQLNTPTRPKPRTRQLDGRGNHTEGDTRAYPVQILKPLNPQQLKTFATQIQAKTGIPVRFHSASQSES